MCQLAPCEMIKTKNLPQLVVKMLIGTVNIISCAVFFYILKKVTDKNKTGAVKGNANANAVNSLISI